MNLNIPLFLRFSGLCMTCVRYFIVVGYMKRYILFLKISCKSLSELFL